MVGFLNNNPATIKQEEEESANLNNKDSNFISPELDDFCSSFLDLESLSDWMNDIPVAPAMDSLFPKLENTDSFENTGGTSIEEQMGNVKLVELSGTGTNGIGNSIPELGLVKQVELADTNVLSKNTDGDVGIVTKKKSESDSSSSSESDDNDSDEVEEGEITDVEKMVGWSDDEFDEEVGVSKGPIKSKNETTDLPPVPPVDVTLLPHHHTLPVGVISSIIGTKVIVEGVEQHNPLNEGTIFWITESRSPLGIVDEIFGPVKSPYYIMRYNSENEVPEGIKQGTAISFVPEFANHVLKDDLYKKGYDASGDNDEEISDEYEFSDDEKEARFRKLQKMKNKRRTNDSNNENELKEKNFKNRGGGSARNSRFSRNRGGSGQNVHFPKNGGVSAQNGGDFAQNSGESLQNNHFRKNEGVSIQNDRGYSQNGGGSVENTHFPKNGGGSVDNNHFPNNGGGNLQNNQFMGNPHAPNGGPSSVATNFSGVVPNCGHAFGFIPNFPQTGPVPGFGPPPNITMANGMPSQQTMMFPNGVMWPQQNMFPNGIPFPQQFSLPPNVVLPGPQPNFFGAPSFGPWSGNFNQNGGNQQVGVAMQPCPPTAGNTQMPQELNHGIGLFGQNGTNQQFGVAMQMNVNGQQRPPTPGNTQMPQEFSQGTGPYGQNGSYQQVGVAMPTSGNTNMPREFNQGSNQGRGRGRVSQNRGGGRFGGGRGRHQPK